jgi:hypothetical protein
VRRLSVLLFVVVVTALMSLPASAASHAAVDSSSLQAGAKVEVTSPTPQPTPQSTSAGGVQPPVVPASGGSTTATDALTIVGFSVVAMAALVLVLRAGLRSAASEDED